MSCWWKLKLRNRCYRPPRKRLKSSYNPNLRWRIPLLDRSLREKSCCCHRLKTWSDSMIIRKNARRLLKTSLTIRRITTSTRSPFVQRLQVRINLPTTHSLSTFTTSMTQSKVREMLGTWAPPWTQWVSPQWLQDSRRDSWKTRWNTSWRFISEASAQSFNRICLSREILCQGLISSRQSC